ALSDTFIVTEQYVAGAGRQVSFEGIEAIEIDGSGGADDIWVLGAAESIKVTVTGGSGDDTIHIGGTPPPIVFQPPPFEYQPPAIQIKLPQTVVYTTKDSDLTAYTQTYSWLDWLLYGGSWNFTSAGLQSVADNLLNSVLAAKRAANAWNPYYSV